MRMQIYDVFFRPQYFFWKKMSYHVNDIDMLSVKKTLFFVKRSEKGVIGD